MQFFRPSLGFSQPSSSFGFQRLGVLPAHPLADGKSVELTDYAQPSGTNR